ncbi:MAG: ABC transporter permease [Promethearchaeati archaeon SRVP18_Atabeyarchaeia-1]
MSGKKQSSASPQSAKKKAKAVSMWGLAWQRFKRNKVALAGLFVIGYIFFMAIFADFIAPYKPNDVIDILISGQNGKGPTWAHPFGTTLGGQDVFSVIVYGARSALLIGFGAAAIAIGVGVLIGIVSAYYGGWVDELLMRFTEIFLVMPFLLIIMVLMNVFNKLFPSGVPVIGGIGLIILVIGLFSWPGNARLIRGEVLRVRESEFIAASKCLGASGRRILFRHILPNVLYIVLVLTTLQIAGAILTEAALSFLGFGDPNSTTWGQLLTGATDDLTRGIWWTTAFPGLFLTLLVLGFNLLGNGLRDALDPRLRE